MTKSPFAGTISATRGILKKRCREGRFAMDFSELLARRQSVRQYQSRPVQRALLEKLVEAVRLAPSASNSQPWKVVLVDEPTLKERVALATYGPAISFNRFASQAPVLAVFTVEKSGLLTQVGAALKRRPYSLIDIGIAAAHFCLQAAELGLGTCMLGWFDERRIQRLLGIPRRTRIGLVITVGHAAEGYFLREKTRKPAGQMSSFNAY
jgi:nitroreductase